jgi:hypothetical protein
MTMILIAVMLVALVAPGASAVEFFKANLQPVDGTGSVASGTGSFVLDEEAGELTYEISVEGLGSPEIGAHFHSPDGTILLQLPLGPTKNGVWSGLGFAQIFQLREELIYVLVHTEEHPGGEVRGDVVTGKVPVEEGSVGRMKLRFSAD